jgi:hypothetical protein
MYSVPISAIFWSLKQMLCNSSHTSAFSFNLLSSVILCSMCIQTKLIRLTGVLVARVLHSLILILHYTADTVFVVACPANATTTTTTTNIIDTTISSSSVPYL